MLFIPLFIRVVRMVMTVRKNTGNFLRHSALCPGGILRGAFFFSYRPTGPRPLIAPAKSLRPRSS